MIAYSLLSVVDAELCTLVDADDALASVDCSSSNRIIFNDSGTTRQVRVSRQGIDRATPGNGGCAERRRQQLERMAGSQKPFVRLVASARCKNNCIKWPRTETGLERFSHLARESCNKFARLLQFSQFSLAPSLVCLPFGQCKRSNRKKTSLPLAGDATEMQRCS